MIRRAAIVGVAAGCAFGAVVVGGALAFRISALQRSIRLMDEIHRRSLATSREYWSGEGPGGRRPYSRK